MNRKVPRIYNFLGELTSGARHMPYHDYYCHACEKTFTRVLIAQHDKETIACPHCGSQRVEQQVSPFSWDRVNLSASEEDDRARVLSDWESDGDARRTEKQAANAAEEKPKLNHKALVEKNPVRAESA